MSNDVTPAWTTVSGFVLSARDQRCRDRHRHADLLRSAAQVPDQQFPHRDADQHTADDAHRGPTARPLLVEEADHRRDRREDRAGPAEQPLRRPPRRGGGDRREHHPRPGLRDVAAALACCGRPLRTGAG
ncbi:hypothetical protein [Saccharopolyspora erythraea]|uniref:hypothetical protein n=1 Tax=Saccharopolyspora erythraea TaxID=1836 RepID=UPI00038C6AA0|nr:hypothetical protein [Saccharopolyspora erythraea]EQD83676.1 hypothetical protein N599_24085 [Saccharopolyspora erythraea D]QRK92691.1 hypothetical protein JQX30_16165 [Saccharopolyspora erythraea]